MVGAEFNILEISLNPATWVRIIPWVWRQMMPQPHFFPPDPTMHGEHEAEWQWWHIPVGVKRRWLRRDIPCCEARLEFTGGKYKSNTFQLRWRSDFPTGSTEATLVFGKHRMLPIVARGDKSTHADLTYNDYLMSLAGSWSNGGTDGTYVFLPIDGMPNIDRARGGISRARLEPGEHLFRIIIKSGQREWSSGAYRVNVPKDGASNSHFTVTMEH